MNRSTNQSINQSIQVCDWLKDSLKAKGVSAVEVSTRLTDSAATLVQGAYGMSPTMQRYMKAQASAIRLMNDSNKSRLFESRN